MALNVSATSIRNPVPAIVLFVVLCFLGWMSFLNLPITRFPNIDVPLVSVSVTQSGAAPSELETQITKKVEDAVANIAGVKNVISNVTDGLSTTIVEFRLEVNGDRALNDVKDAIAKVRGDLPRGIEEPIVERVDVENQSILTVAVAARAMTPEQLSWFVDDVVRRDLQGLRGIGRVDRRGGVTREIRVSLDPDRLMSLGITAADVNRQLRATNVDLAGGRGDVGGQEQSIRTLAGARTVDDLAATTIVLPGGRQVRLSDLGTISDTVEEPRSFSRLDGETPIVSFSIFRTKGASDARVAAAARERIAEIAARAPDVTFSEIDNSVNYTEGNYKSALHTLMEGAALTVIVVLLFLRDLRATIISAVALPLSIIPTFWVMELMGFSFNLVSLLAIILVTGILVDDAIVEIENIVRHMKMGKSPYRAAMEAADEIGLAVIAISLTIVAVFAPVSFMGGVAGQYFKQFGLVVAVAVLFSLLVARLITPMMAAYFMRPHAYHEPKDGVVMRGYLGFLRVTTKLRYLTLIVGIALFATSIWAMRFLPTGFIPFPDESRFVISVELPPGSNLNDTRERTDALSRVIKANVAEVQSVLTVGGVSPTGTREVRRGTLVVRLSHKSERERTQREVMQAVSSLFPRVPDIRAWYVNDRGERELSIIVRGTDPDGLNQAVAALESGMRRQNGFVNVAASAGLERPEIRIVPRAEDAARYGVTTDQISEAVRVATIGDAAANLARFNAGDRLINIRVQLDTAARASENVIENLTITTPSGVQVPLAAVADIVFAQGPSSIERYNRVRRVNIGADLVGMELGQGSDIVFALPEAQNLPAGVSFQKGGDAEIQAEVFQGFFMAMITGLLMVLGVLVLLFGSVFQPITILLSLPLSIGGVVVGLLATNNAISMPVVIGILMLMGIVTKNAIMLVDFAVEEVKAGVPRKEAILDAGRKRARPIIMTTIAMVAGMVPVALGVGDGGEFRSPMAIAVIGGLIVSTVLSLVFVPSFYLVMDDLGWLIGRLFSGLVGPKEEEPPVAMPAFASHAPGGHAMPATSANRHPAERLPAAE